MFFVTFFDFGAKMVPKRDYPFVAGAPPKITKIKEILQMGPRASKMGPWASNITKNHDSDLQKSRKSYCKLLAFYTLVFNTS